MASKNNTKKVSTKKNGAKAKGKSTVSGDSPVSPLLATVATDKDVRLKDVPAMHEFKNPEDKEQFLYQLKEAMKDNDWTKGFIDAINEGVVQVNFAGNGFGDINTRPVPLSVTNARNADVANVNKTFTIEGQVKDEPNFILPLPAKEVSRRMDEDDLPEYVLSAFLHPAQGFALESTVDVGNSVHVVYHRDPEYFEVVIRIGELRRMGDGYMEVNSLVVKDGAAYSVTGKFSLKSGYEGAVVMTPEKQPRAMRLYKYLSEKLGLV